MSKIPPVKPEKMIKILEKFGFKPIRQKGSHIILINKERIRMWFIYIKVKILNLHW